MNFLQRLVSNATNNLRTNIKRVGPDAVDDVINMTAPHRDRTPIKPINPQADRYYHKPTPPITNVPPYYLPGLPFPNRASSATKSAPNPLQKLGVVPSQPMQASTRTKDGFPFPDYRQSAPGQVIRADLDYRNKLPIPNTANIQVHMKSPSGRLLNVPQSQEHVPAWGQSYYGLEVQIPQDAEIGDWQMWSSVNGQEVLGSRQKHPVINAAPVDRYNRATPRNNPTFSYNQQYGPQSELRALLNRALGGL